MARILACISCVALLPLVVASQSAETRPAFEAADIHVSAKVRQAFMQGPYFRGDHYEIRQASMLDLIAEAYGKDSADIAGGPSWLEMNRYDILAKMPAPKATEEARNAMLQALLAERFHLVVHNDSKPGPALALTAAKHPLLKKAEEATGTECKFEGVTADGKPAGQGAPAAMMQGTCHNMTMKAFADSIRGMPFYDRYFNHLLVVEQTGLAGGWDFSFKFSFPGRRGGAAAAADFVTPADALEKQLGLKLEPTTAPVPALVVDRVDDKPTANVANIAAILHATPDPTEFEVASIKPSDPGTKDFDFNILRGGKVDIRGCTMKFLIQQAWSLSPDMMPDAPKWMDEDRYDIVAKAPAASLLSAEWQGLPIDLDTVLGMIRSMLADRFKLAVHMEERPIAAYNLVALKPKLKAADPLGRSRFKEGPATAADAKNDPRNKMPVLGRFVTVQNMTLAQFAERLPNIAGGYIKTPVLDKTGIEGSFDFTLSFSGAGAFRGGPGGGGGRGGEAAPPSGDSAADPSGAISLFEAVERQLGLKLESVKRPVPVLVIDHVERKPTEN